VRRHLRRHLSPHWGQAALVIAVQPVNRLERSTREVCCSLHLRDQEERNRPRDTDSRRKVGRMADGYRGVSPGRDDKDVGARSLIVGYGRNARWYVGRGGGSSWSP
jgi:hypothetical protein